MVLAWKMTTNTMSFNQTLVPVTIPLTPKTQHRDTVNIGYTRHRTETNKQKTCFCLFVFVLCLVYPMLTVYLCCVSGLFVFVLCLVYPMLTVFLYCGFVCLSLSCYTTQRYCQHWVHQTQEKYKQTKNTTHRYCQHWVHQTQNKDKQTNVDSISVLWFCLFVSVLFLVYPMLTVSMCCVFFSETNKQKYNAEMLSTLGTPDTGQRVAIHDSNLLYMCVWCLCSNPR
jgi:uncharacterized membrane protein